MPGLSDARSSTLSEEPAAVAALVTTTCRQPPSPVTVAIVERITDPPWSSRTRSLSERPAGARPRPRRYTSHRRLWTRRYSANRRAPRRRWTGCDRARPNRIRCARCRTPGGTSCGRCRPSSRSSLSRSRDWTRARSEAAEWRGRRWSWRRRRRRRRRRRCTHYGVRGARHLQSGHVHRFERRALDRLQRVQIGVVPAGIMASPACAPRDWNRITAAKRASRSAMPAGFRACRVRRSAPSDRNLQMPSAPKG